LSSQIYSKRIFPADSFQCSLFSFENCSSSYYPTMSPFKDFKNEFYLICFSLRMSQVFTNMTVPESMKTRAFRLTAAGFLLSFGTTYLMHISSDKSNGIKTFTFFYHMSVFIVWNLASFATLLSCEWKIQRVLFIRHIRERFLRQQLEHNTKIPPIKADRPICFDALMLAPYAYSMAAAFESILRTAIGDQSEQREIATIFAHASFMTCCSRHLWRHIMPPG
jgi:hypothetical protein